MKASDLRIGNYVIQDNELIKGITSNSIHKFDLNKIKLQPILLTEDWLLKFGFEEDWCFSLGHHETRTNDGENYIYWVDSNYITEIKYVHQLQNLYFALTGKELEIKE